MRLKTYEWKKVTYLLICVFAFFVQARKRKQKKEDKKREKSSQGNVLKENQKKQKSPHKVIYGGPSKLVKVHTAI